MRSMRTIVNILGVLLAALVCVLAWQFYATSRNNREAARMDAVFESVSRRLNDQRQQAGQYPVSLSALSLTNAGDVELLRTISYGRTRFGYTLSYTGFAGYHKSYEFSDETGTH